MGSWEDLITRGSKEDMNKELCTIFKENSDKDMIVSNQCGQKFCSFQTSTDAVKEFLRKETEHTVKGADALTMGFVTMGGHKALAQRAVYIDFFLKDRVEELYPPMYKIMADQFSDFAKEKSLSKNEFKEIDIRDFFNTVLKDWLCLLLFGFKSANELKIDSLDYQELLNSEYPLDFPFDQKIVPDVFDLLKFAVACIHKINTYKLNGLLFKIPQIYGLTKDLRGYNKLLEITNKKILGLYYQRYNEFDEESKASRMNIVDIMVYHNKKCLKNGKKDEIIEDDFVVGNLTAFLFGGYDSSVNSSVSCLMRMAQSHQDWIEKIKNDGVDNITKVQSNHSLDLTVKEALRLVNPINTSFPRIVIKDLDIKGVQFTKGDMIFTTTGLNRWNTQFKDAETFRPDRFEQEMPKLGKFDYIPFGEGKRKCLAYGLGLTNMKILMGQQINVAELKVDEKYQIIMENYGIYQVQNPMIQLKLR